jgi:hypothetical protein
MRILKEKKSVTAKGGGVIIIIKPKKHESEACEVRGRLLGPRRSSR